LDNAPRTRIELCGELVVRLDGRRTEAAVPGVRGRLLLAYLLWNRRRAVSRDELIDVLWPADAPASPDGALSTLLTRLRRALGDDVLKGRSHVAFAREDVSVDTEEAADFAKRAAALATTAPTDAAVAARAAVAILEQPFLPGIDVPWTADRRRELDELRTETLEVLARASLALGGSELATAETAARDVIDREPYRESAYALLMEAAAARGNVAEALMAFDELRVRLREDLGTSPARHVVALNDRLVRAADVPAQAPRFPAELTYAAPRMVGRGLELEQLRKRWRAAAAGRLQVVLVTGEAGVGKTSLVAAIAREAGSGTTLYGRADDEAIIPFQPFVEATREAVRLNGSPALPAAQRAELARFVPDLELETSPSVHDFELRRYALFEAVTTLVRDTALTRPVLLALDDLHWADTSTLLMLRHLVRGAADARVLVVATARSGEATHAVLDDVVSELERRGSAERIALGGLDEAGVAALVAASIDGEPPQETLTDLLSRTNGNPLFIEETLRGLDRADADALAASLRERTVPTAVHAAVRRRVARLGATAGILECAAVAGSDFRLRVVEAALPDAVDVPRAVDEAVRAGLLVERGGGRLSFAHALVREALYEQQTETRRSRTHARVADVLGRDPAAEAAERAHHAFHGRDFVGSEVAADLCVAAAEDATTRLAHEDAALQYERALAATDDDARRPELLLALADALERAGDLYACRARFEEAARVAREVGAPSEVFARAALGFAKWQEYGVVDTAAIALLEQALATELGTATRARVLGLLAVRLDRLREQDRRESVYAEALASARRSGDRETAVVVLAQAPFVFSQPERVRERLEAADETIALASESGHSEWELSARVTRFVALLTLGDIASADEELAAYTALAEGLRHPWSQWYARMLSATRALLAGDVDRGRALSDEALELRRVYEPDADEVHVAQRVMAAVVAGRPEEIELVRVRAVADRFSARPGWRALYALAAALTGELRTASDEVERYSADGFDLVRRGPDALNALALLGEAAAVARVADAAPGLYAALSPFADRTVVMDRGWAAWGSASRQLALLAALLGRADDMERHAVDAVRHNERLGAAAFAARVPPLAATQRG
jgi:DNA-binding SARP family transcriptional activator